MRLLTILLAAGVVAAAGLTAFTIPASAQSETVTVRLPNGQIVHVTVDVPPGGSIKDVKLPGTLVDATETAQAETPAPPQPQGTTTEQTTPAPPPQPGPPSAGGGSPQGQTNSGVRVNQEREKARKITANKPPAKDEGSDKKDKPEKKKLRNDDGTPTPSNPGFIDALPGPSTAHGVPNFIIRKFRVPPFLLSIYQAAGIQYGIRWEILAAINEIETDYGRNLNVSSAGAVGWMQFMPSTWKMYGTDANKDKRKDPYNPVDAIFAAARYLKAAGYQDDVRRAIFAYNHADWYVDSVLLRARLIAGVPADLIGSLTGLTEGRFPVYARARYADDLAEAELLKRVKQGENAANVIESADDRRSIDIYARSGSPGGRGQRRGHQEDRDERPPRPLRDAPGRLRQPLHLRAPRLGRAAVPGAQAGHGRPRSLRARGEGQRRPARPEAVRARVGGPPARGLRRRAGPAGRRARGRAGERAGQGAPVRAPRHGRGAPGGRARPGARRQGAQAGPLRDLPQLLLAPVRARPEQGHAPLRCARARA